MLSPEELYVMDVKEFTAALYRMGYEKHPNFTDKRARVDLIVRVVDGVEVVVANGNGFSAFDHLTPIMRQPGKVIWKIFKGAPIPEGLRLVKDLRPGHEGHFMIAPQSDMPLKKFLGLLEELAIDPKRMKKLTVGELHHA
jgi:hypothetical protein